MGTEEENVQDSGLIHALKQTHTPQKKNLSNKTLEEKRVKCFRGFEGGRKVVESWKAPNIQGEPMRVSFRLGRWKSGGGE